MQLWDDVLYPPFRNTIRGEYYGIVSQDLIDEECFGIAQRAVSAFKFPRISTEYKTYYAVRSDDGALEIASPDEDNAVQHAYFVNELSYDELEVIIAWMKFYWAENQVSNSDNFDEMYTDANIKTFSRANAVDKSMKLMVEYRKYARDLENRYSRTTEERKSSMRDLNE